MPESASPAGAEEQPQGDERGATLILALVFIVAVSLIVIPLADWATNSLNNTGTFQNVRTLDYALSSTVDTAIQAIRNHPEPSRPTLDSHGYGVQPVGFCWAPSAGTTSSLALNGYTIDVWCQTTVSLPQAATRVVTLYACSSAFDHGSEATCQAAPQLEATVTFDDYPANGGVTLAAQCNIETGSCGFSQIITKWVWATQAA
ncbi:MAG: hypothetical protein ACYC0H_11055 [Solirubrobacteraceae bacterium]